VPDPATNPDDFPVAQMAGKFARAGGVLDRAAGAVGRAIDSRYGPTWAKVLKRANLAAMATPIPGAHPIVMGGLLAAAEGHRLVRRMFGGGQQQAAAPEQADAGGGMAAPAPTAGAAAPAALQAVGAAGGLGPAAALAAAFRGGGGAGRGPGMAGDCCDRIVKAIEAAVATVRSAMPGRGGAGGGGGAGGAGGAGGGGGAGGAGGAKELEERARRGLLVGAAYAYATSKLLGFVRAGLEGSTAGVKLSYSTQMLERQIASVFLPAIETVIGKIQALTEWFRGLSGEQQRVIARFTGLGLAALAAAKVVPRLADALKVVGVGSPLLLVAGGLAAILARSGEGRAALVEFGDAAMGAFAGVVKIIQATLLPVLSGIADAIETVVMPVIEGLTVILDSAAGRWVIFGGLMVALGFKVVASFAAIRAAAAGMLGPFGLVLTAVAAIAGAIGAAGAATRQFGKEAGGLAEQVHKGQSTQEKAREDIRVKAALQAEEEAEKVRGRHGPSYLDVKVPEEAIERRRAEREQELIDTGNKEFDRILKRLGGAPGRSDVQPVPGAAVSPADLIKKIEAAALLKDTDAPRRTAEATEGILATLKGGLAGLLGKPADRREDPDKAP
jgi:hypothetical protein